MNKKLLSKTHYLLFVCFLITNMVFSTTNFNDPPHPLEDNSITENNVFYFDNCVIPLAKINLCFGDFYDVLIDFDPQFIENISWEELTQPNCYNRMDDCPAYDAGCDSPSNWTVLASDPQLTSYLFDQEGEYRVGVEFTDNTFGYYYFDVNLITPVVAITPIDPICVEPGGTVGYGSVDILVSGGFPDYQYRITGGPGNIDVLETLPYEIYNFTNLEPGTYSVEVMSGFPNSSCFYSETVVINPPPPFEAEVILISPESCDTPARVQVNVITGQGGTYEYADIGGVFTTNNIFDIPSPANPNGVYTFSVSDLASSPNTCVITADITGIQPYTPFVITNVLTNDSACPQEPGSIDVSVASSPPVSGRTYTYQLFDCANDPNCDDVVNRDTNLWTMIQEIGPVTQENINFPDVANGISYAISVSHDDPNDPNGPNICRQDATIYAIQSLDPTYIITTIDPVCADQTGSGGFGSVEILVNGGIPDYQYRIFGGPNNIDITELVPNPVFVFDAIEPGTYTVDVFSGLPNSQGCFYSETVVINPAPPFEAEVILVSPESCNSGAMVQVNVTNGSGGPYEYAIAGGVFGTTNIFEIPSPADPNASYTFSISDTSSPITCLITAEIEGIMPYTPFVITDVVANDASCAQGLGSIDVSVATTPVVNGRTYTYQLYDCANDPNCNDPVARDTGLWTMIQEVGPVTQENINFPDVGVGSSYAISVYHNDPNDPNGSDICRQDATIYAIQASSSISASVSLTRELSCFTGQESAQVLLTDITGGSGSYEWSIDDVSYTAVTPPSAVIDFVNQGVYTIYVRDTNDPNCPYTESITIEPLATVTDLTIVKTFTDCIAQTVDVIPTASPTGISYDYQVTPTPIAQDPTTGSFTLSTETTYVFTAKRFDTDCSITNQFFEPVIPEIQITNAFPVNDVLCFGGNDGIIQFEVNNSSNFNWEVIDLSGTIVGSGSESGTAPMLVFQDLLMAGEYTIFVADVSSPAGVGCTAIETIVVTEASPIIFDVAVTDITAGADGLIEVTNATGGAGSYAYQLSTSAEVLVPYQTNDSFSIDTPGTYIVSVLDANGCEVLESVVMLPPEDENPVDDFADDVVVCTTSGDNYPIVNLEDPAGEVLEIPYVDVVSIIWQILDNVSCTVVPDENCPTTDIVCESDWIQVCTGPTCTIDTQGEYRIIIQFANRSVNSTQIYYFKSETSLSIDDLTSQKINLYPNPSSGIVALNTEFKALSVFDMTGKNVLTTTSRSFNVAALENGIYFVRVIDLQGKEQLFKFMKN